MNFNITSLSFVLLISSMTVCLGGDLNIPLIQAPASVQSTIQKKAGSNKIVRLEKADDEGQIRYEALIEKKDGKMIEYIIKPDGTLDSTEEPITQDELPGSVDATLKKATAKGKAGVFEKITRDGTVTYEVGYKSSNGGQREAVCSSEGILLKNGSE